MHLTQKTSRKNLNGVNCQEVKYTIIIKKTLIYLIMNLKIISFCNYPYREIALNWVKHLEALAIDNYEVLCLDSESHEYLKSH